LVRISMLVIWGGGGGGVLFPGRGNFTGGKTLGFDIERRPIYIASVAPLSKMYDGDGEAMPGPVAFSGIVDGDAFITGEDYVVSAEFTGSNLNAGTRPFTYTIYLHDTQRAANYVLVPAPGATAPNIVSGTNGTIAPSPFTATALTIDAPTTGATPAVSTSGRTVSWSPADNPFLGGTVYTVTATYTGHSNFTFLEDIPLTVNGVPATNVSVSNPGTANNTVTVTHTFPRTSDKMATGIQIITQPAAGSLTRTHGDALNLSALVVRVTYDDLSTADNPQGLTITPIADGTALVRTQHDGAILRAVYGPQTVDIGQLTVNPRRLTPSINAANIVSRAYDGTTNVPGTPAITLTGALAGENPTATASFAFTNANVGNSKVINATNITLAGTWGGNYTLTGTSASGGFTGVNITRANPTVWTSPTATTALVGSALSTSTLSGGVVNGIASEQNLAGTWAWATGTQTVNAGANFQAIFTPTGTIGANYNTVAANARVNLTTVPLTMTIVSGPTYATGADALTPFASERRATFVVDVSGFPNNAHANNVRLTTAVSNTSQLINVSGHDAVGHAVNGTKRYTVSVAYNVNAEVPEGSAVISVTGLSNMMGGYVYNGGASSLTLRIRDGFENTEARRILVRQANIGDFNTFARGTSTSTGIGVTRHYRLVENVTLAPPAAANGSNWTPIGSTSAGATFSGSFDGGGHTISGLTINTTASYQGMFATVGGGTVRNLGLVDVNISGGNYAGGIAGHASAGAATTTTISNSYVIGNVSGTSYVGGMVGYTIRTTISNTFFIGSLSSRRQPTSATVGVGGIVGRATQFTVITNCYAIADITGSSAGGIVGDLFYSNSIVRNCYAAGSVRSTDYAGGVVGMTAAGAVVEGSIALNHIVMGSQNEYVRRVRGTAGLIGGVGGSVLTNNRAWDEMIARRNAANLFDPYSGTATNVGGTGTLTGGDGLSITSAAIRSRDVWTSAGFAFGATAASPWVWEEGKMPRLHFEAEGRDWLPHLRAADGTPTAPFMVYDEPTLRAVGRGTGNAAPRQGWTLDRHYKLAADVDLTVRGATRPDWEPIGIATRSGTTTNVDSAFTGSFDGGGHTITGLRINSNNDFQGMFAAISGATVSNLYLEDVDIRGNNYVGGAVGNFAVNPIAFRPSQISNVHVTGTVRGYDYVGGMVGGAGSTISRPQNSATGAITNSSVNAAVTSTNAMAGGIAGGIGRGTAIINCYVGGRVTTVIGTTTTTPNYSMAGGVVGTISSGGGTTAVMNSSISNCYVTADVTATGIDNVRAGGIAGEASAASGFTTSISRNYVTGRVTATSSTSPNLAFAGGIVSSGIITVEHNVAANEVVKSNSALPQNVGRIGGGHGANTWTNNRAWSGISIFYDTDRANPMPKTIANNLTSTDGLSISTASLLTQSTWGANGANNTGARLAFGTTNASPWIWQADHMPRLYFQPRSIGWPCWILGTCAVIPAPAHTPPVVDIVSPPPLLRAASDAYALTIEGSNIVTTQATFAVQAPEGTLSTIVVYNYMGNVVFVATGVKSGERVVWDLTNTSGRPVSAGSYLAIATSRDRAGKALRGSVRLGGGR
jgi:hypothetical protein